MSALSVLATLVPEHAHYNHPVPLLPLFPLDVVLFPGMPLPLHIFEPRYKEMIAECVAAKTRFGVVRAEQERLENVGCSARIVQIVKRYDDGRLDIVTEGERRFFVGELDQERSFLRAEVSFFEDEIDAPSPQQCARLIELHTELMEVANAEGPAPEADLPNLSFALAAALPVDNGFKQAVLAMRSERQRVALLLEYYEKTLPRIRRVSQLKEKASSNGHGLH